MPTTLRAWGQSAYRCRMVGPGGESAGAVITRAFPGAVPMGRFLAQQSAWLRSSGFAPDDSLAVSATCRDEILAPLRAQVRTHWHRAFDFSSLSGLPLAGLTGVRAALGHAPQTGSRTEIVVFALPHIGLLANGTLGQAMRRGRVDPTAACGSLIAAIEQTRKDPIGAIDPDDPEQSLVRARLISETPDLAGSDLVTVTRTVQALMVTDLWRLLERISDADQVDVALVSGVVVHGPEGLDFVEPGGCRLRLRGRTLDSRGCFD